MLKVFNVDSAVAQVAPRVSKRSELGGVHGDGYNFRREMS